jgi:hypothetical protein
LQWDDGAYTIQGAVEVLGVTKGTVHDWLKKGLIKGRSLGPYMLWQIDLTPEQIQTLRQQAEQVRLKRKKRPVAYSPQPGARPEAAATRCVGMSPNKVCHDIENKSQISRPE